MKKYSSIIYIVGLACAGLIFTGCATNQATAPIPANSGHLLINRVANFGTNLSLVVSVDGKNVGGFTEGRSYSGYLPAGQHKLSSALIPTWAGSAQGGRPWLYKQGRHIPTPQAWSGGNLTLVRNQGQSVPVY